MIFIVMDIGCGIQRYDQQQEKMCTCIGFDIVVQCIILRERLASIAVMVLL